MWESFLEIVTCALEHWEDVPHHCEIVRQGADVVETDVASTRWIRHDV